MYLIPKIDPYIWITVTIVGKGLKCDWIFNNHFIENLLLNMSVKVFWKSANIV